MDLREHLSSVQLTAYLQGWVDDSTSDSIEQHLAECPECEETFACLEKEGDTLVQQLRQAKAGSVLSEHEHTGFAAVPRLPHRMGAYELQKLIGQGGMGAVYQGQHIQLKKSFAIKLVHLPENASSTGVERFGREVRAAGGLSHPAIVAATDAGQHGQTQYLVMDLVVGSDLGKITRSTGSLKVADACEIARLIADGLAYAHTKGVVHRDIKPSNLMLSHTGEVKILDFGLAQLTHWDDVAVELTTVGQLMGTLDYMAPEQAERPETVDYRVDLYSLGATLFRFLCGRPPLSSTPNLSPLAKLRLLANHSPPRADTLRPGLPKELADLIETLLASDPVDRPASASHVAELLQPFCDDHDLVALSRVPISELARSGVTQVGPLLDPQEPSVPPRHPFQWRWLAAAALPFLIAAGFVINLQLQKGQLVIDSEAAVTVNLIQGGKNYEQIKVQPGTTKTRLYAGTYEITIDNPSDSFSLDKDSIRLEQGDVVVARIRSESSNEPNRLSHTALASSPRLSGVSLPASDSPVQPGDKLHVFALADEALSAKVTVLADDTIKLRLIGFVSTRGKTIAELERQLNDKYKQFFSDPGIELYHDISAVPLHQSVDLPQANEPLYSGKSFSDWVQILEHETSKEGVEDAAHAVVHMAQPEDAEMLSRIILEKLDREVSKGDRAALGIDPGFLFGVLSQVNPGQRYVELLSHRLQDGDEKTRIQTIENGFESVGVAFKNDERDWTSVLRWFEKNVLQGTENAKLVDRVGQLLVEKSEWTDNAHLELLVASPRLSDEFFALTILEKPFPLLVTRCMERIETNLTNSQASDDEIVSAISIYFAITASEPIPFPEFKDRKAIVEHLAERMKKSMDGRRVRYETVPTSSRFRTGAPRVRQFPGYSVHDWYAERIGIEAVPGDPNTACLVFDILDFVSLIGGESMMEPVLKELKAKAKVGHNKAIEFLSEHRLLHITLLWPDMSLFQRDLRRKGIVTPASGFEPKNWFDVFTYERVVRMLASVEQEESKS
ncbi:protein kinase domain-containing protein [Rhodopirellula europaea]|uniref:protein kinase domain-containing protein n=1 Tax=Rhodopirellula europaea TaxID=1263866 RepID=UPI003D2DD6E5|tara:strand:+ start:21110 stop:24151 length:3042 start_codon:yes stop_codon:yes gene_type:complete